MLKKYNLIILAVCIIFSCKESNDNAEEPLDTQFETELPDGFHDFYTKFHSDSIFQMSRIVFPLKGVKTKIDSIQQVSQEVEYLSDNWKLHRPFTDDGSYTRNFQVISDLVIENIGDNMGLMKIERRWGKIDSSWSLIYYATQERSW